MESPIDNLYSFIRNDTLEKAPGHCRGCSYLDVGFNTEKLDVGITTFCSRINELCIENPKDCEIAMTEWDSFPGCCRLCPSVKWLAFNKIECIDGDCEHSEFLENYIKGKEAIV